MALKDQVDQDALAAEWGVALESDTGALASDATATVTPGEDEAAAQWAAMVDEGGTHGAKGGAERILNQDEID